MTEQPTLVDVRLTNFPLDLWLLAQEHADGVIREFTLIAHERAGGHAVDLPRRLVAIVDELSARFGGIGDQAEAARDAAIERGERYVDLRYRVPAAVGEAARHLGDVLDEADEYCRRGQHLLSLATPPEAAAFRRWFIDEFVRQTAGAPPQPWPPEGSDPSRVRAERSAG